LNKQLKKLYKVELNWFGQVLVFYTHATSEQLALTLAVRQLATKLKLNFTFCNSKFRGQKANFNVVLAPEKKD
jgi:hypothetical protein